MRELTKGAKGFHENDIKNIIQRFGEEKMPLAPKKKKKKRERNTYHVSYVGPAPGRGLEPIAWPIWPPFCAPLVAACSACKRRCACACTCA